jgi:hypothetical protein
MARYVDVDPSVMRVWDEAKYRRDAKGRFASKGGGSGKGVQVIAPPRLRILGKRIQGYMRKAKDTGLVVPDRVLIEDRYSAGDHLAQFRDLPDGDEIRIYGKSLYWKPGKSKPWADTEKRNGFWSSASSDHILNHEMGHLAHSKSDEGRYTDSIVARPSQFEEMDIEREVSTYATGNYGETIAEMFAGMLAGEKYDASMMNLYDKFSGPSLPVLRKGF